ncbi:MAG: hypothetical protein ACE5IY_04970 [bacterium]
MAPLCSGKPCAGQRAPFAVTLRAESDRHAPGHEHRYGAFSYGYSNLLLIAEGRAGANFSYLVAGEREHFSDRHRKFWPGFRFGGPDNLADATGLTLRGDNRHPQGVAATSGESTPT